MKNCKSRLIFNSNFCFFFSFKRYNVIKSNLILIQTTNYVAIDWSKTAMNGLPVAKKNEMDTSVCR